MSAGENARGCDGGIRKELAARVKEIRQGADRESLLIRA
jgi:hypothetical protein